MSDEERFADLGETLRAELAVALPGWVEAAVRSRLGSDPMQDRLQSAIEEVVRQVDSRMVRLIAADVDEPLSGPLEIVRQSVGAVTEMLAELDVPASNRDPYTAAAMPSDSYDLGPMTFLEISEAVHDAGIRWGAGKAYLHLSRRSDSPAGDESAAHD